MGIFRRALATRRRTTLVLRFALLSALSVAILGGVLVVTLQRMTEERTVENAEFAARLVANLGIQAHLSPGDFDGELRLDRVMLLDEVFRSDEARRRIARIKIWDTQGRILYSDDHTQIGDRSDSDELQAALRGRLSTEIEGEEGDHHEDEGHAEAEHEPMLEVYVPIQFEGGSQAVGAFEVYMLYEPIASDIQHDARTLILLAAGGLALLWLVLWGLVAQASRRERRNIAELARHSERNEYLALHDVLTGLPNRALLRTLIQERIGRTPSSGRRLGLVLLDLNRFKEVNDTLGHHHGDALLQLVGPRLESVLSSDDVVARLGGDEFAVLLGSIETPDDALRVVHGLDHALEEPFDVAGLEIDGSASFGIALFPEHGSDVDTLMQHADVAMYLAKESHERVQVYSAERDRYTPDRLAMVGELRRAIDNGDVTLHYQPKIDLRTGELVGVEALARWNHAKRGVIPPDEFIPLAERTGLIRGLTRTVLRSALLQRKIWSEQGFETSIAVNLSTRNLLDSDLPGDIGVILAETGCAPADLDLEITESTIMADPVRAQLVLKDLSAMGVGLAIDDFGTGYSSLQYLKDLPVGSLKIDRSFVKDMARDLKDDAIVRSTIDLARNLELRVIAEGVETAGALERLAALGCDHAQGYFIARPIPAPELLGWAAHRSAGSAPASTVQTGLFTRGQN